ncbi:hypothetical protein PybrP1_012265 [[Pythium] brassicae (nom. inval.)]|nr:hypothetical protein PybrP1_012265 [[Pythium] brassicae (nom. inval.)]
MASSTTPSSSSSGADFGYGYEPHAAPSGERPKLYMLEHPAAPPATHHITVLDGAFHPQQLLHHGTPHHHHAHAHMTPQHAMGTPQHRRPSDFDPHEPLMMSVHGPNGGQYYAPLGAQMLHVSADYDYASSSSGVTPSSARAGSKRSREDLNLKEKKRMFKLNDRINQLKDVLDEAGVQCKKNKQSILDNAAHYIDMLRSNLLIAKQKAERAEREAESFRQQSLKGGAGSSSTDKVVKGSFQKTSTPRVIVDLELQPVAFNSAFAKHAGQSDAVLKKKGVRPYLCVNAQQLESLVKRVSASNQSATATVEAACADGVTPMTLVVSAIVDDKGKQTNLEISLIPVAGPRTDGDAMTGAASGQNSAEQPPAADAPQA